MNVAIIGGGASGLMAGGYLSNQGHSVTIFDGNEKVGKKLFITGKGRCNLTNNCSPDEVLANVVNGEKFLFSAIYGFPPSSVIELFEQLGLKVKTERGNRVFPLSDKSSDVIKALERFAEECDIKLNEKVLSIKFSGNKFVIKSQKETLEFDRVIIATGGKSYPATGSTGDGYRFAKMFGHTITEPHSALVPIKIKDKFCANLEGLSLKNVTLSCEIDGKAKSIFGEMLFTSDAISGPIALSMSSFIGLKNVNKLSIDFKPALTPQQLDGRLLRDFEENLNKNISYIIKGLLPQRFVSVFMKKAQISCEIKVNSITKQMREKIVQLLKNFPLEYGGLYPIEAGIVTSGGVSLKEINPKTMESKLIKGLYFIGEVLDFDCLTGGFNLQCCFATAIACAKNLK